MHTVKGDWVGQTFALATTDNGSGGRKSRIRHSKQQKKTMVKTFIKKYQNSNNGKFPSLNLTHKAVGGSFYIVREIVREIIQENKVLGPAKLPPGEQNNAKFAEQYPLGSISTEPHNLYLSSETHGMSNSASNNYIDKSEEAGFGMNTQLDLAEVKVIYDGLQTSTSDVYERIEQSDESYIVDSGSDHQKNKDAVLYSSGISGLGLDYEMLNEQTVGDYEATKEDEISSKSDLLNDLSMNHQNTNGEVLDSTEIISEHVNESLISEVDAICPTVKKDETYGKLISTELVARKNLDAEGGTKNELEASKAGLPLKTTELMVEKFPLRPIAKKIDELDSRVKETINLAKSLEETEHKHDRIMSLGTPAQLVNEPDGVVIADPTSEKSRKIVDNKAEIKDGEASLETSSASEERTAAAMDIVAKASSTVNGTVDASNPMLNETGHGSSDNGASKEPAVDELMEGKGNASYQTGSSKQKGINPPLDRIHLETWEGATSKSRKRETNPLVALLRACIGAFVKFWTEE